MIFNNKERDFTLIYDFLAYIFKYSRDTLFLKKVVKVPASCLLLFSVVVLDSIERRMPPAFDEKAD